MPKCLDALNYYQECVEKDSGDGQVETEIMHKWNLGIWLLIEQFVENKEAIDAYEYYLEELDEGYHKNQIEGHIAKKWDEATLLLVKRAIKIDATKPSLITFY